MFNSSYSILHFEVKLSLTKLSDWCHTFCACLLQAWPSARHLAREIETVLVENGIDPDKLECYLRDQAQAHGKTSEGEQGKLRRMNARYF